MDVPAVAALGACAALVAASAWTDWRRREIPHAFLIAMLALWVLAAFAAPGALGAAPLAGLVCGGVALLLGYAMYAFGAFGGGDGKLLAAAALWLGPGDIGLALLGAAALLLAFRVRAFAAGAGALRSRGIPFACALAPPTAALLLHRGAELLD